MSRPWLSKWFRRFIPARPGPRRRPAPVPRRPPLLLEPLENRCLPSTFTVTTLLDTHAVNPSGVDQCGQVSLRSAIEAANYQGGNQTIQFDPHVFAASQTIDLTLGVLDLKDTSGVISIQGAGAGVSISGDHATEVFRVESGASAELAGLTICNGQVADYGGGIFNAGQLTINHCTITDNVGSGQGGGIYNEGTLTLLNSSVTNNSSLFGGGLLNAGQLIDEYAPYRSDGDTGTATLTNDIFSSNSASFSGGGILNSGTVSVCGSTISCNTAESGGGIMNEASPWATGCNVSTLTLRYSTISGNTASSDGGGIYSYGAAVTNIANSTLSGNVAGYNGGGIYAYLDPVTLVNTTLTGNSAGSCGGAISIDLTPVTVDDCTIVGNNATYGGGIDSEWSSSLVLNNTIVANNPSSLGDIFGYVSSASVNNLIGIGDWIQGDVSNGVNGNQVGTSGAPINPQLDPLGNYGGPTQTMMLLPGSPAIGAGSFAALPSGLTTDQRGVPRIIDGSLDIGAVESGLGVIPTTTNLALNAPALTITGQQFDSTACNNTVTLSSGAGVVTAATETSLTVTFTCPPTTLGPLTAVVTTDGKSIGPVQVATVVPPATVSTAATNVASNAQCFTIAGSSFDPTAANNTVVLSNGATGTVTAATPTSLTVTLTHPPTTLGPLTAVVTTDGGICGAAVQVATLVAAPTVTQTTPTSCSIRPPSRFSAPGSIPPPPTTPLCSPTVLPAPSPQSTTAVPSSR